MSTQLSIRPVRPRTEENGLFLSDADEPQGSLTAAELVEDGLHYITARPARGDGRVIVTDAVSGKGLGRVPLTGFRRVFNGIKGTPFLYVSVEEAVAQGFPEAQLHGGTLEKDPVLLALKGTWVTRELSRQERQKARHRRAERIGAYVTGLRESLPSRAKRAARIAGAVSLLLGLALL